MTKIYEQMPKIMKALNAIGKDSKNVQQGFKYRSIDAVYNELHHHLADHGVFTAPEVVSFQRTEKITQKGAVMTYTIATIKYKFFADDGSFIEVTVIGEGSDAGDKSANKSMAVAHKYALLQVFCIPTEDSKDPDEESHEVGNPNNKKAPAPTVDGLFQDF